MVSHKPALDGRHVMANIVLCVDKVGYLEIITKLKRQNADNAIKRHSNI